jgi:hypothetical protein
VLCPQPRNCLPLGFHPWSDVNLFGQSCRNRLVKLVFRRKKEQMCCLWTLLLEACGWQKDTHPGYLVTWMRSRVRQQ